jgi:MraZ protein
MIMFSGVTHLNLDDKGRIAVPAMHREEVNAACEGRLVITIDMDHCLLIYPFPQWEKIEQALMSKPNMDRQVRRLQRLVVGHAQPCDMSAQGRLSIPASLREYAGLDKQATLVGQGKKLELWDAKRWQEGRDLWLKEEAESLGNSEALDSLAL